MTHLPALPMFPVEPTNLQHQMASQPGTALNSHRADPVWTDPPVSFRGDTAVGVEPFTPRIYPKGYRELMLKIIKDFERTYR